MQRAAAAVVFLLSTLLSSGGAVGDGLDLAAARQQFSKSCGTCHTAEPEGAKRQGPSLFGVYGRRVGEVEDFAYSDVLASGDWIWTAEKLDLYIQNARKARPGTTMAYRQRSAEKRALIIAYLRSLSAGH